jgi:site-specific DNA-methyltransferase (adenine-specific)
MKTIADKSVHMILVDLPYGLTKNKWDTVVPFDEMWAEFRRISKENAAIVLFANNPFGAQLIASNLKEYRYSLVWEKNKFSDFLNAKRKPMKIHEDIHIFYRRQPNYTPQYVKGTPYERWNTAASVGKQTNYGKHTENRAVNESGSRLPTTVLKFNRVERPEHPTQKPVDLLEWLVRTYTKAGDTVLDCCMGSGSTGVASKATGRSFVGIELSPDYFKICQRRLQESVVHSPNPSEASPGTHAT